MRENEPRDVSQKKHKDSAREKMSINKMDEEKAREIVSKFREMGADLSFNGEEFVLHQVLEDGKEIRHVILAREKLPVMNPKDKNSEIKQRDIKDIIEATWRFYGTRGGNEGTYALLQILDKKPDHQ